MAKSVRKITNEQFSAGTTIDGDRLDKALNETTDMYNNLPLSTVASLTSKQIYWGLTAAQGIPMGKNDMGANTGYMYGYWLGGPLEAVYDGVRNANQYMDPGATPVQNFVTYKGTGKNIYSNPLDKNWTDFTSYKYRWENSYLTHKPCIIKELSFMGMWDDGYSHDSTGFSPLVTANKYYPNDWQDSPNPNISGYEVIIAVDNNLNLANTINRDNEARVWATPPNNFMVAPWGNTTNTAYGFTQAKWADPNYCGYGDISPYPNNVILYVQSVPAGIHIQLKNLEIPVHEFGRIRVCLILPKDTNTRWETNNTILSTSKTPSCFTNMWSASMTILEELDSE